MKDWFDAFITSPGATADPLEVEHLLQLATAVMLVDVMRADASFRTGECELVRTVLVENFALTDDEAARLAELEETTASQATDLFGSTSRINDHFDMPQNLRMVEQMWRVAHADRTVSNRERHVMWRIADLLHVPQGAYVYTGTTRCGVG